MRESVMSTANKAGIFATTAFAAAFFSAVNANAAENYLDIKTLPHDRDGCPPRMSCLSDDIPASINSLPEEFNIPAYIKQDDAPAERPVIPSKTEVGSAPEMAEKPLLQRSWTGNKAVDIGLKSLFIAYLASPLAMLPGIIFSQMLHTVREAQEEAGKDPLLLKNEDSNVVKLKQQSADAPAETGSPSKPVPSPAPSPRAAA